MKPFLERLAHVILDRHGHELDRVAVVLPGQRAGLYLRRYLAQAHGGTFWSPELLDMGGFMERLSGMRQGSTMELLFLLHEVHLGLHGQRAEPLEEFLHWAPVSLRDMSEADAHLLDHANLYRDLRQYHEIEQWSFRLDPLSHGQERLLGHWRSTGQMHALLLQRMTMLGIGTSGSLARAAAEGLRSGTLSSPWSTVLFAGLNALEPAPTAVVEHLQQQGLGHVAWDADNHYLSDKRQEAGLFLRRSVARLGPGLLPPVNTIMELGRTFRPVAVTDAVAQTRAAAQVLAALSPAERANTAVVLADEHLLMPLLEALPADIGPVNVTMGMPVEALPIHGLTEAFIHLHIEARADGTLRLDAVERLLLHPFLHQGPPTSAAITQLRTTGQLYLNTSSVLQAARNAGLALDANAAEIFMPMQQDMALVPRRMDALLGWAKQVRNGDRFVQEQLFRMARLHHRLHQALDRAGVTPPNLRTYADLRTRLLREERIGFFGEPLSGLQIMGFLETRAIDHPRVLLLGAQEGSLPRPGTQQSWIPFDIRRTHQLPLPADTEAVTAYHFHRLMHLATDVHVCYGGDGGAANSEPSRFITQWLHEVVGHSATIGRPTSLMAGFPARRRPVIAVAKDDAVMKRLVHLAEHGLSPSALGTFLRCPLDYWFRYGLRVRQAGDVDGRLASDVLGDAVHKVLEEIHLPWVGKQLVPGDLLAASAGVRHLLRDMLLEKYPASTLDQGHFRLRMDMAAQAMTSFLKAEALRCERSASIVLAIELDVATTLRPGIELRGRCDRIEQRDGVVHVLDMKTGSVESRQLQLKTLARDQLKAHQQQALQLLVYAFTYLMNHPEVPVVRAGIVPLQRVSRSDGLLLKVADEHDIHRGMMPEISALLGSLTDELLDPQQPFIHDPDSQYCTACIG